MQELIQSNPNDEGEPASRQPKGPQGKVTINIPRALYNNLKEVIVGSGFDSVTDFVVYVLRDIASAGQSAQGLDMSGGSRPADADRLTKEELEAVRRRLQALGYL